MPKQEEAVQATITMADLQKLLETMGQNQLEQIKELKKPYVSEQDIENARLAKQRFRESEKQAREYKETRQRLCTHLRPEDGRSLFFKMRNVFPRGAYSLICCRCNKLVQNYDPEIGKLVVNEEFDKWINVPTGTVQG